MGWFKGQFSGKPHIQWENRWFPVDFHSNQSIDIDQQIIACFHAHLDVFLQQDEGETQLSKNPFRMSSLFFIDS